MVFGYPGCGSNTLNPSPCVEVSCHLLGEPKSGFRSVQANYRIHYLAPRRFELNNRRDQGEDLIKHEEATLVTSFGSCHLLFPLFGGCLRVSTGVGASGADGGGASGEGQYGAG